MTRLLACQDVVKPLDARAGADKRTGDASAEIASGDLVQCAGRGEFDRTQGNKDG
jgi:hypothetical protein